MTTSAKKAAPTGKPTFPDDMRRAVVDQRLSALQAQRLEVDVKRTEALALGDAGAAEVTMFDARIAELDTRIAAVVGVQSGLPPAPAPPGPPSGPPAAVVRLRQLLATGDLGTADTREAIRRIAETLWGSG